MFTNLNVKPIFPQYTISVNRLSPNTTQEGSPPPSCLPNKTGKHNSIVSLFTGGHTQHQGDA